MPSALATKELSKRTWPDYVHFFSQGNGWDHCGCTFSHGFRAPKTIRKWADQRDWNLEVKRGLLEDRRTHGILVYADREPVGWCQFGPANELPIAVAGPRRQMFAPGEERVWKITCFCTRPDRSCEGITAIALQAALRSIEARGGGVVQAYPVALVKGDPSTDERLARQVEWRRTLSHLIKVHGRTSEAVEEHLRNRVALREVVEGVGEVDATSNGRAAACGTVNLFRREGFEAVGLLRRSRESYVHPDRHPTRIVMRKTVGASR